MSPPARVRNSRARRRTGTRPRPAEPPEAPTAPAGEVSTALPRALAALGSVVAPASVLTGLLLYFGRLHATGFFAYLGVSYTTLDLTTADYLVRSADGMIPPLVTAGILTLLVLWGRQLLDARVGEGAQRRVRSVAMPAFALVGTALVVLAVLDAVTEGLFVTVPELRGLSLAAGVLLLIGAASIGRRRAGTADQGRARVVAEWAVTFVLVSVGLFFAVGTYASGVGTGRGILLESRLSELPGSTVFSGESLGLSGPGVRVTRCAAADAAYTFRYDGLVLVLQSGGQYLLLPRDWHPGSGAAILLPRDASVRLEFTTPGAPSSPSC